MNDKWELASPEQIEQSLR